MDNENAFSKSFELIFISFYNSFINIIPIIFIMEVKNYIAKVKRNKTAQFKKSSYVVNYYKNNKQKLVRLLEQVFESNPDWWNWKAKYTAKKEANEVTKNILNNAQDKGTQTTISSLYYSLLVIQGKLEVQKALEQIHDNWCYLTYFYEGGIKEKRKDQFVPFRKLSTLEKLKDLEWIYAMMKNQ